MSVATSPYVWFDASITPHNAMSATGRALVATSLALLGLAISVLLISMRAWPAALFTGAEMLALVLALQWSSRRLASQEERIVLSEDCLTIESWLHGRRLRHARIEPAWIKIERVSCEAFGCQAVYVRLHGGYHEIGSALSPSERESLADALESAISRRKCGLTHSGKAQVASDRSNSHQVSAP